MNTTQNVLSIEEHKLKKTVNLYLLKCDEINKKLDKFLEGKDERKSRNTER